MLAPSSIPRAACPVQNSGTMCEESVRVAYAHLVSTATSLISIMLSVRTASIPVVVREKCRKTIDPHKKPMLTHSLYDLMAGVFLLSTSIYITTLFTTIVKNGLF